MIGEVLTRWTIRLALAAYVGRVGMELTSRREPWERERRARWLWTIGCLFLWIHVVCAFHFYHQWSHAGAYAETLRQTAVVTGFNWGGGIWINYLLMLVWAGDVGWWWLAPASYQQRRLLIDVLWQAALAFIIFNATVVFKTGTLRWVGLLTTAALMTLAIQRFRRSD